jgi:hypothetical protein
MSERMNEIAFELAARLLRLLVGNRSESAR